MKKLSQAERRAIREILAAKNFDDALHRTPESILERLFQLWGGTEGAHDFFDSDMFPNGVPKPLSPKARARLDAQVEKEVEAPHGAKTKKAAARRGRTVTKKKKAKRSK